MKRSFTKEELDVLAEYESRFRTSMELGYTRNLEPRYIKIIQETYSAAMGEPISVNATCSHCVVEFMKRVGKKYFEDKQAIDVTPAIEATKELGDSANKAAQLVKALDEIFDEVPDELEPTKADKPAPKKSNKKATNKK